MWRACLWLLAASALLLVPAADAQPPALQPRIDTHPEWNDLPSRSHTLADDGKATFPLESGSRVFVSGGAFACQPDTTYRYTLKLADAGPTWGTARLEPEDLLTVTFTVPPGAYQSGWPGPTSWYMQPGPSFVVAWDLAAAPNNATHEYRITGDAQAQLVSGGCQPDPLGQPTRHIAETINITKPYVPPPPATATPSDGCIGDCVIIAPITEGAEESPAFDLVALLLVVVFVAALRRAGGR